jgi:hypothetical protein
LSTVEEFTKELYRMADMNGIYVNADRVLRIMCDEIDDEDARFVNVFNQVGHKNELLVITSVSSSSLVQGLLRTKVEWQVRHEDLREVRAQRGLFRGYVHDDLVLEARDKSYRFQFGFFQGTAASKHWLEMAQDNAGTAEAEISQFVGPRPRVAAADPALEELHRSMALIDSEPPSDTESCEGWTLDDYEALFNWMKTAFSRDQHRPIWERRLALGYNLDQQEASNELWFWINAFPALAGLNLGLKEHPFVATCAGSAEQVVDRDDIGQMTVMNQIKKLFFG